MRYKAYGKVNLGLDVVRKREDGYHEVRMIMQTVGIYDRLEVEITEEPGITIETNLSYLPCDENNLIYKAAKLLMDEFEIEKGIHVELSKHIPVAAGMAGGSTDAAAIMVAVNQMFGLSLSQSELMERGVRIGADVPYCIMRGTALSEGIGEILTPIAPMPECSIVVAKPSISVSTKYVYENLKANELKHHPDIDGMKRAIEEGNLEKIAGLMENVLETVTEKKYPVITQIKDFLKERGALNAMMSGSGPTVFGIFADEDTAGRAYEELKVCGLARQVFLTGVKNSGKHIF